MKKNKVQAAVVTFGVVGLIILYQIMIDQFGSGVLSRNGGVRRGDIRLAESVLPAEVNGWKVTVFHEPEDDTAEGIAWSHSWTMQKDQRQIVISFDQVGFMGAWHELTRCYEAKGCSVIDRKVMQGTDNWDHVQATIKVPPSEVQFLMYSIFNGKGETAKPPNETMQEKDTEGLDELPKSDGPKLLPSAEDRRILQVQLLVDKAGQISNKECEDLEKLHQMTREIFRQEWLKQVRRSANRSDGGDD